MPSLPTVGAGPSASAVLQAYIDKVVTLCGANLLAYWPVSEAAGSTLDNYEGTAARDGSVTGVTLAQTGIGDGLTSGYWDGANDYGNVYSASLSGVFSFDEGTLGLWANFDDWACASDRGVVAFRSVDDVNQKQVGITKLNSVKRLYFLRRNTSGEAKQVDSGVQVLSGWHHLGLTWSVTSGLLTAYIDGVSVGTPQSGLTAMTWTGLKDTGCSLGSNWGNSASGVVPGKLAHLLVCDTAVSGATMLAIATVG